MIDTVDFISLLLVSVSDIENLSSLLLNTFHHASFEAFRTDQIVKLMDSVCGN